MLFSLDEALNISEELKHLYDSIGFTELTGVWMPGQIETRNRHRQSGTVGQEHLRGHQNKVVHVGSRVGVEDPMRFREISCLKHWRILGLGMNP